MPNGTGVYQALLGAPRDATSGPALEPAPAISLRRLPYPYRAMLAICSDLDETPDRHVYLECMRFLNTATLTTLGPGIGLEVGNSIYFDMRPGEFSYWNTDDTGRALLRALIRSGHIDCIHSFGDLATTRAHAGRALDELSRHDCSPAVWTDHARAPSNFGDDIMCGLGDVQHSIAYHADLTCDFGIQYVWRGRITSIIGQDRPRRLHGICNRQHPFASIRTVAKEVAKGFLARGGSVKYAMHGPNRLIREVRLRSGQRVLEFMRANPFWAGVSRGDTAEGLANVLTMRTLSRLVQREGLCILYTHLGKIRDRDEPLGPSTRAALSLLARFHRDGKILVTTTHRLLRYCWTIPNVTLAIPRSRNDHYWLDVDLRASDPTPCLRADLEGLSLYVPDPSKTHLRLNGSEVFDLRRNGPDHTGRPSVSLPWLPLEFPDLQVPNERLV